jgi:glycosyltransferase involved in cell wall biosynthesis
MKTMLRKVRRRGREADPGPFLFHVDRKEVHVATGGYRGSIEGWVLRERYRAAHRVWIRLGEEEVEAVRIYRPDVILSPGGNPADHELPGFAVELPLVPGLRRLELWAEDEEGDRALLLCEAFDPGEHCDPAEDPENRFSTFRFVTELPWRECRGSLPPAGSPLSFQWVIPDFGRGSGGHAAIFRTIQALEAKGHRCRIWIFHRSRHGSPERVRRVIGEAFVPVEAEVRFLEIADIGLIEGDVGVATDRWTAYYLRAAESLAHRFYLVQDFEPDFYPKGSAYFLAEDTYRFGFTPIVSSGWLAEKLSRYSGETAAVFGYGIDHDIYRPREDGTGASDRHRIVFYARAATSRRVVEIAVLALELLGKRRTDFTVDFFGEDLSDFQAPFDFVNRGVLSAGELADLYRGGTLGIVFSATNHAILAKEMMACGLPVLELEGENLAGIYPPGSLRTVPPEPTAVAAVIEELLDDPEERRRIREAGLSFVRGISWTEEIGKVVRAIEGRLESERRDA